MFSSNIEVPPLGSFDADCVPVRKDGRPVWASLERPDCFSSLPWNGTKRWTAAGLQSEERITRTQKDCENKTMESL